MFTTSRVLHFFLIGLAITAGGCSKSPPPAAPVAEPAAAAPVTSAPTATGSLSDLHGPEWKLERYSDADAVPAEVSITLAVAEGQVSGQGGCNRYTGSISSGDAPGKIVVGPLAATMMACVPPRDAAEQRYLKALQQATSYTLQDGRLLIAYKDGDEAATLVYSRT